MTNTDNRKLLTLRNILIISSVVLLVVLVAFFFPRKIIVYTYTATTKGGQNFNFTFNDTESYPALVEGAVEFGKMIENENVGEFYRSGRTYNETYFIINQDFFPGGKNRSYYIYTDDLRPGYMADMVVPAGEVFCYDKARKYCDWEKFDDGKWRTACGTFTTYEEVCRVVPNSSLQKMVADIIG